MILRKLFDNHFVSGVASISVISVISAAFVPISAHAVNLLEVYKQALKTYPYLKSQEYTAKSTAIGDPIARATAFFPTVTTSASYTNSRKSTSGASNTTGVTSLNLNLSQPIFNYGSYHSWRSAQWTAKSAFSKYFTQKQEFIISVVSAYFSVLQEKENLDFAKSTEQFSKVTLKVSQEQMKVGLATMNDVKQSLARYDSSLAGRIAAENAVQTAKQKLSLYTGEVYESFAILREDFLFDDPKGSLKEWEESAQKHNNSLIEQRQILQASDHTLSSARGAYFPSVGLTASYIKSRTAEAGTPTSTSKTYTIALNLNWTLFKGLADFETVKQKAYLYGYQEANTAFVVRDILNKVDADYFSVGSEASQVKANLEAVMAGESAVKQALAQYQVGVGVSGNVSSSSSSSSYSSSSSSITSPLVNLLEKIQLLEKSQLAYSTSKYSYINSKLSLANNAGFLSDKQVIALNAWLTYDRPKDLTSKYPS